MAGKFETKYRTLSDRRLNNLARRQSFSKLSKEDRLALMQEFHNREAARMGFEPFEIRLTKMNAGECGYYNGEAIYLNERFFSTGIFRKNNTGCAAILSTVFHEGRHAFQDYAWKNGSLNTDRDKKWMIAYRGGYCAAPVEFKTPADNKVYALYTAQDVESDARRYARHRIEQMNRQFAEEGEPDQSFTDQAEKNEAREVENLTLLLTYWTEEELLSLEKEIKARVESCTPDARELISEISYFEEAVTALSELRKTAFGEALLKLKALKVKIESEGSNLSPEESAALQMECTRVLNAIKASYPAYRDTVRLVILPKLDKLAEMAEFPDRPDHIAASPDRHGVKAF